MKNRLKFRIFCKSENKMMLFNDPTLIDGETGKGGLLFKNYDHKITNVHEVKADDLVIMQSTGLQDINKKIIFEGDIVRSKEYPFWCEDKYNYSAEICWAKESAQFFYYVFRNKDADVVGRSTGNTGTLEDYDNWEVIGNIYENPELLEEDE